MYDSPAQDAHLIYKFTGKERDAETGLDDFGARYYSSAMGRFATPDWSSSPSGVPYADLHNPQSLNLYLYVNNNPESLVDPTGHFVMSVDAEADYANGGPPASAQQPPPQQQQDTDQQQQAAQNQTDTQQVGNIVHNETGGLRPETKEGSGSGQDLHNAKVAISDVVQNREKAGINGGVASDKVSAKERNTPQYKDAQQAASEAARSPDLTGGSKNFYLDYGQPKPRWAQGKATTSYGPFKNAAGGGDVPKGHDVRIIIVHPEDQQ